MSSLLVAGGRVIDPRSKLDKLADVLIEDGRVAKVAPGLAKKAQASKTIDAKGKWVLPGLVDMHVHLREPGREGDETIATGSMAAARGGVTTVLAMANTEPVADTPAQLQFLRGKADRDAVVNVLFAAAVTVGQKGERLSEFARLKAAGAAALSDDGRPLMNAGLMRRALEYARDLGLLVIDHCEDLTLSAGGCAHEGSEALRKGLKGIPAAAETVQVARDIELSRTTGAPVHIAHLSTAGSVDAVRLAKKRGIRVSAEACPHHFVLADEMIPGYDADWKMNPPLRAGSDREAVLEGLADGTIDAIATDHAPHGCAAKSAGFDAGPFGVIGLETSLSLAFAELVGRKVLDRKALVERMSARPAELLGLGGRKGTLAPGADGDLVVFDPEASWTAQAPYMSLSRNTPFAGRRMKGAAAFTVVGGRVVHAL